MVVRREAFYIESTRGRLFTLVTAPAGTPRGDILYVPPFAEEMNKSRRMVALAARAFAEAGWLVLQVDLFGCGDSEGDFGDADWLGWLDDLDAAWQWLSAQHQCPVVLWSLRGGALLGGDWLRRGGHRMLGLLCWQPVLDGRQHLTHFLRVKLATEMLAEGDAKVAMADLRTALAAGQSVEVAGYVLSPSLARGLEEAEFVLPSGCHSPMVVCEVTAGQGAAPSPAYARLVNRISAAGVTVGVHVVAGPAFWQTVEIEEAPELICASIQALEALP